MQTEKHVLVISQIPFWKPFETEALEKSHTVCKQRSSCKLSLDECHRKYVWSDIKKCSPPVAVTAGFAGANLISQGEVSRVVGGVLTMHNCKHELYPNQVSLRCLISLRKCVRNPGLGGRTMEKSCHQRTPW